MVDDGSGVIDQEELVIGSSAKRRIEAYESSSLQSTRGTPGVIMPPSTAGIPPNPGRAPSAQDRTVFLVPLRHAMNHQWQKQTYSQKHRQVPKYGVPHRNQTRNVNQSTVGHGSDVVGSNCHDMKNNLAKKSKFGHQDK